jgi:hypothetical protein
VVYCKGSVTGGFGKRIFVNLPSLGNAVIVVVKVVVRVASQVGRGAMSMGSKAILDATMFPSTIYQMI